MSGTAAPVRPRWVMIASVILLVWNLIGVASFAAQWNVAHNALNTLPVEQQAMWRAMPGWAWAAYAIAVGTGTLGTLVLVLRKGWAVPLLATSLIAVLVQFFNAFALQDGIATVGTAAIFLPLLIIVIGIVQLILSRRWKANGWIG